MDNSNNNAEKESLKGAVKGKTIVITVVACVLALALIFSFIFLPKNKKQSQDKKELASGNNSDQSIKASEEDAAKENEIKEEDSTETTESTESAENSIPELKFGEIYKDGDLNVGVSCVTISDKQFGDTYYSGTKEMFVLNVLTDYYNSGKEDIGVSVYSISCEVDGKNADSSFDLKENKEELDGIDYVAYKDLCDNTCATLISNFIIPKEFKEIKIFYEGKDHEKKCAWVIGREAISKDKLFFKSLYDVDYERKNTPRGTKIYSDKYEITYDGYETVSYGEKDKYIAFKFTLNNTGTTDLDYMFVGNGMMCYAENYYIETQDFERFMGKSLGEYKNISDIETIAAGEEVKFNVQFRINKDYDDYRMVFNKSILDNVEDVYVCKYGTTYDVD